MAELARDPDWPRTVAEFQEWHARQPERWEFIGGVPIMMAPGSMGHSVVKRNAFASLHAALADRGCEVLVDGPQVLTDEVSAIPDVVVTCSPLDLSTTTVPEPVIIVEVLSPSSENNDLGYKWRAYRQIPSLRHYLVLFQDKRLVNVHTRAGDLWHERFISEGAVELEDPAVRLEIDALYASTDIAA